MKEKRGQVTLFVIIAILIVVAGVLFFIFRGEKAESDFEGSLASEEVMPVKNFVTSCIEKSVKDVVYLIGQGGGYSYPPNELSDVDGFTYYFKDGDVYFPKKNVIEKNLEKTLISSIVVCVDDFNVFLDKEIEDGEINVNAEVFLDKVVFDVNYPIIISKGEERSVFENFGEFIVDERLGEIYSLLSDLIKDDVYSDGYICLSCFSDLAYENNLSIDFLEGGDYGSIFVIKDAVNRISDDASLENENSYFIDNTTSEEVFKFIFASD